MLTLFSILSFILIISFAAVSLFAMMKVCVEKNNNRVPVKVRSNRSVYHRPPKSF